jgi:hypothetical protein
VGPQDLDMNDPSSFFVRFAPTSGGLFLAAVAEDRAPALALHDATEATGIALALRKSPHGRKLAEL